MSSKNEWLRRVTDLCSMRGARAVKSAIAQIKFVKTIVLGENNRFPVQTEADIRLYISSPTSNFIGTGVY